MKNTNEVILENLNSTCIQNFNTVEQTKIKINEELNKTYKTLENLITQINHSQAKGKLDNKSNKLEINKDISIRHSDDNYKETIRISEELFRKDKIKDEIYISELFKKNFVNYDKNNKSYISKLDASVVKEILSVCKLMKTNQNMYSINSIRDLYSLQIICFANEISKLYTENLQFQSFYIENEKILKAKDEQIQNLKEKIDSIENNNKNKIDFFDLWNKNLKNQIFDKLQNNLKSESSYENLKIQDIEKIIIEDNFKLKMSLQEILTLFKNNRAQELNIILKRLANEMGNEKMKKQTNKLNINYTSSKNEDPIESNANQFEPITPDIRENLEQEARLNIMLVEFEKMMKEEYKKLENYYFPNKHSNNQILVNIQNRSRCDRKSISIPKKKKAKKNYIGYKENNTNENWFNSLRNDKIKIKEDHNENNLSIDNFRHTISKILTLNEIELPSPKSKYRNHSSHYHFIHSNDIISNKSLEPINSDCNINFTYQNIRNITNSYDFSQNLKTEGKNYEKNVKHLFYNFKKFK